MNDLATDQFLAELREHKNDQWGVIDAVTFAPALIEHLQIFPDLTDKLIKFVDIKITNPLTERYGKHDRPCSGPLVGFWHAHLRDDAILIYNLLNRCVNLVYIVSHSEIEGRKALGVAKKLAACR